MREIKFRAWRRDLKKLYPSWDIWVTNLYDFEFADQLDLMQYTGLKDCKRDVVHPNGQEIYEGDIVRTLSRGWLFTGAVVWKRDGWDVDVEKSAGDGLWYGGLGDVQEVIGNIYENPELLT